MFTVLSIDGGGIRGIIPARWLAALEKRIGSPLAEHFDLVAGTSTGAILAAGIAAGIPAERLATLYEEHGARIFPPQGFSRGFGRMISDLLSGPRYSTTPLEEILKEYFGDRGEQILLGQANTNCLVVAYDVRFRLVRALKSWDGHGKTMPIWEACKASCSAPTYFPAHLATFDGVESPLIDGGVVANNPSSIALAEAISLTSADDLSAFEASRDLYVVSMGTGNMNRIITADEATKWGTLQWAIPILDVVFDGTAFASDLVCKAILKNERYVRLQIDLDAENEELDDVSPENLMVLKGQASTYISDGIGAPLFERIVHILAKRQPSREPIDSSG